MPVFQLIYRSRAQAYFSDDDLISLLRQCRTRNIEKNVTGLLLYGYGNFVQLLEGDETVVLDLYDNRIATDPRHQNLSVLHRATSTERLFKNWSMAFRPLDAERLRIINPGGYLDPDQPPAGSKNLLSPLRYLEMMQGFSHNMQR